MSILIIVVDIQLFDELFKTRGFIGWRSQALLCLQVEHRPSPE